MRLTEKVAGRVEVIAGYRYPWCWRRARTDRFGELSFPVLRTCTALYYDENRGPHYKVGYDSLSHCRCFIEGAVLGKDPGRGAKGAAPVYFLLILSSFALSFALILSFFCHFPSSLFLFFLLHQLI
jgi:hypothetical protein